MTHAPRTGICIVGSVNVDTTYLVSTIPDVGETVLARTKSMAPGGKGANQAVAAATMGSHVSFIGCTGNDPQGRYILEALAKRAIDVSAVETADDVATGTAVLVVDDQGENTIVVDPGANQRIDPEHVRAHLAAASYGVVLAQLEVNLEAVLSASSSCGEAIFILNPAPMPAERAVLAQILEHTDVLVPNRVELARFARCDVPSDPSSLDHCVASLGFPGAVLVTLGRDGVAVYQRGRHHRPLIIEAMPALTVDTAGAGDVFCGVLAHALAEHGDLYAAARRANEIAALSTTFHGAQLPADLVIGPDGSPGTMTT